MSKSEHVSHIPEFKSYLKKKEKKKKARGQISLQHVLNPKWVILSTSFLMTQITWNMKFHVR